MKMKDWMMKHLVKLSLVAGAILLAGAYFFLGGPQTLGAAETESGGQPVAAGGKGRANAIFAGGCFWCVESDFDKVEGVTKTTSGYIGGKKSNPTYEEVSAGRTGHFEALRVEYDPARVNYEKLLYVFWRNVDPFDAYGQFCDKGEQYRSAIFYANEEEKKLAMESKTALESGGPLKGKGDIATLILPQTKFYPAEDYHQGYYKRNPTKYKFYRWNCGRDARLEEVWGKEANAH
jgi:peptide-methionine (S)-S-oxide reductase